MYVQNSFFNPAFFASNTANRPDAAINGQSSKVERQAFADSVNQISERRFDFTSISPNELGEAVKSGELSLMDVPVILPPEGLDLTKDTKAQMDAFSNQKIDFIQYLKERIDYRKSVGQSTEMFENSLNKVIALQRQSQAPSLDVYA